MRSVIVLGMLVVASVAQAQTAPFQIKAQAVWTIAADVGDPADVVESVALVVDGATITVPAVRTGDTITVSGRPGLSLGLHNGSIAFCNVAGCGPSASFAIQALNIPSAPKNLRVSLQQLANAVRGIGDAIDAIAESALPAQ